MAQQQGLAFSSGGDAQEALSDPAEQSRHEENVNGNGRPNSGKAFDQLRRFSSQQQHKKAAELGGVTSRQAIFPAQVRRLAASIK